MNTLENDIHRLETDIDKFKRIDRYKVFSYFLISGFIGWIFETAAVWVTSGKLTDRGFLFIEKPLSDYFALLATIPILNDIRFTWGLPIIFIYGIGGTLLCCVFKEWADKPLTLFAIGFISLTVLELFSSYLCSYILHTSYWNYSHDFLNFQGRICLRSSIAWGVLSVIGVKIFAPFIDRLYLIAEHQKRFKIVVILLITYVSICALIKYFLDPTIISH